MIPTILMAIMLGSTPAAASGEFKIDREFEGANVLVDKIEGTHVYIRPDLRDTSGNWFYWNFRVKNAAGKKLTFHLPRKGLMTAHGPAVSSDQGATWNWLGKEAAQGTSFEYSFRENEKDVQFCVSIPYTQSNLASFLKQYEGNEHLQVETLCQSKKNRRVLRLHLGKLKGEPDYRVMFTCRHHACEMIASYALEGIISTVLSDTKEGEWFREHVEFLIVPIVDHDGVQDGDQGKNRKPRDHNRDYVGKSIHPEVKAIRELVPKWSQGKLVFFLDMHCPGLNGRRYAETIYFVEKSNSSRENLMSFCRLLEKTQTKGLPYLAEETVKWGQGWNKGDNYLAGVPSSHWAGMQPGVQLASTIEIPYADVKGTVVSRKLARHLGSDIANALYLFLQKE